MESFVQDLKANNWRDPLTMGPLTVYRFGHWVLYRFRFPIVRIVLWLLYRLLDLFVVRIVCRAQIPAQCQIGPGLHLPHGANTIVIHKDAVIGSHVTLFHEVTIGGRNHLGTPVIGNHVFIGAGAKILGPVQIGEGANIGANAVVIRDVPAMATAVGVPAQNKIPSNVVPIMHHYFNE